MVLLLSPQHKDYALRVRSFPSLTAACVFDWFHGWPEDALLRVARAELTDTATEYAIEDIDGLAETVKQ
jgi:dynein heavy chain